MRFLKKILHPFKKPVPPENPASQITNIGAESRERVSFEKDLSADGDDGTDLTIVPVTIHEGGSRIENQQILMPNASDLTLVPEGGDTGEYG